MGNLYDTDFVAWAYAQASLLRSEEPPGIDTLDIAEELEGAARSEKRELCRRVAELMAHLLIWPVRFDDLGNCSRLLIQAQRDAVLEMLDDSPSLRSTFDDQARMARVWRSAVALATAATGRRVSDRAPLPIDQVLDPDFFPEN